VISAQPQQIRTSGTHPTPLIMLTVAEQFGLAFRPDGDLHTVTHTALKLALYDVGQIMSSVYDNHVRRCNLLLRHCIVMRLTIGSTLIAPRRGVIFPDDTSRAVADVDFVDVSQ